MKKLKLFVVALAMITAMGGNVLAEENKASLESSAGITPDNVILYPIDKALDNLKFKVTSDAKEADVLVDIAEERLGESEVMTKEGKTELSEGALGEYNDKMEQALDNVKETIEKESDKASKEKLEELNKLQGKIKDRQKKSLEVLKSIEAKLPEKAKTTISKVIEMQEKKRDALEKIAVERGILKESKTVVQQAREKLEEAKKSGDAEAIKAAELTLSEQQKVYESKKAEVKQTIKEIKGEVKGGINSEDKEIKQENKETKQKEVNSNAKAEQKEAKIKETEQNEVKVKETEQKEIKQPEVKKEQVEKQKENEKSKSEKEHKNN